MTSIPRKQPDSGATPPRSQPGYVESTRRTIPTSQPAYTAFFEGYRGYLHLVQGIPHIGYGHVVGPRGWRPPDHDVTMHNEWIPEPLARTILQYDLERAVHRLMDILGPEVWRKMDTAEGKPLARWEGFSIADEVKHASPRQIALMDIVLNMGSLQAFPKFAEAVKTGKWLAASLHLLWRDAQEWGVDEAKEFGLIGGASTASEVAVEGKEHTAYYKTRPERAELNAQVILTGGWPDE